MSEADILASFENGREITWSLIQWWISLSFASMLGSYFGAQRLTKAIVALIIFMYTIATAAFVVSILQNANYVTDAFDALELLSASTELSPIGAGVLNRIGGISGYAVPVFAVVSYLFTISFVIYSYRVVRTVE